MDGRTQLPAPHLYRLNEAGVPLRIRPMHRVHHFGPGPAALPLPVLERLRDELPVWPGAGMSVLEISHRSARFQDVLEEAETNLRKLLKIPEGYHVLFLPGGASLQFAMVPLNLGSGETDYVVSGSWSRKAFLEACKLGRARAAWDGQSEGYTRLPEARELKLRPDAAYVHFTSNETIQGLQFRREPPAGTVPLVCDASSDLLSRPLEVSRYGLIYAGAQKNAGAAGVTLVIVRHDLLERVPQGLPTMLDYRVHVEKRSTYNTPPVYAIYIVLLVTRWLLEEVGSLEAMARRNREKAERLYGVLDASEGFYRPHARPQDRSWMNVTWRLREEALEPELVREAEAAGLHGLRGHRSVGGLRASLYNAVSRESVEVLCDFLEDFRRRHG